MKYIKRKSAVKPITGSIVDTTNIADKTSNTYSANVIDSKLNLGSQGWINATLNTQFYSNGTVKYVQIGKIVIVNLSDLIIKNQITGDQLIASGLPPAKELTMFTINGTDGGGSFKTNHRMVINTVGNVGNWYDTKEASEYVYYYGQVVYIAQ